MLLPNPNVEVGQCCNELFIVQTDSIASRVAVPPSLILILCIFAERAQYAFKVMLIFEPNVLLYECKACRLSVAWNRGCRHVASDLDTISWILSLVRRSSVQNPYFAHAVKSANSQRALSF